MTVPMAEPVWFGPEADVTDVVRIIIDIGWEVDGVESPG